MSIPQTPSPLSNIIAAKTYNAAWFSGSTKETQITTAIAAAVLDGALYVYVPANMLPYNASAVTFNNNVKMLREGGDSNAFDVQAYGAANDGITDATVAFQATISAAEATVTLAVANGCLISIPSGKYLITSTLNINTNRVHILGNGIYATQINFNPTVSAALFKFQASNPINVIYQCSIRKLSCTGQGTQQKIAFDLWDSSEFTVEEVTTNTWTGNSGSSSTPSISIRTNGREVLTLRKVDLFADRPIHIRVNPNAATLSADHFHFQDLYFNTLVASETGILIDANCVISNFTCDGYQAWVGGKYGLDFTAGGAVAASLMADFHSVRYEQSADATGFAFRWQPISSQHLSFYDCYWGGVSLANGGVYIRNTSWINFNNNLYSGGAGTTAYDLDTTCDRIWFWNSFPQDLSVVNLGTLVEVLSMPKRNTNSPIPETVYYCSVSTAIIGLKIGGVPRFSYKASVAAGGNFQLPLLTVANGLKAATVLVAGYSPTGPINEGGMAIASAGTVTLIAGTTNFAVGNVGGKLCVFFNGSGNPILVLNNTAQTLSVVVDIAATFT